MVRSHLSVRLLLGFNFLLFSTCAVAAVPLEYQPDYDRGYDSGYPIGYDSGFALGQERGNREGTEKGNADGYSFGWNETYQPSYDRAYDERYPIGHAAGWEDGVRIGFEEGVEYASVVVEAIFGSATFSNAQVYGGGWGGLSSGSVSMSTNVGMWLGDSADYVAWRSDPNYDWVKHYFDLGYDVGVGTGNEDGDKAGYNLAYPPAYEAAYKIGYADGTEEGIRQGTRDGGRAGFDAGWDTGWDEGYDFGFDEGLYAGVNSQLGSFLELYGIAWSPAYVDFDAAEKFATTVPEPATFILLAVVGTIGCVVGGRRRR